MAITLFTPVTLPDVRLQVLGRVTHLSIIVAPNFHRHIVTIAPRRRRQLIGAVLAAHHVRVRGVALEETALLRLLVVPHLRGCSSRPRLLSSQKPSPGPGAGAESAASGHEDVGHATVQPRLADETRLWLK